MIRRYPGTNQDLVARLLALKNQAQIMGQVKPDYAPVVAASLANTREGNFKDAMMELQERGLALAQKKQAAQAEQFNQNLALENQKFSDSLAFQKQTMADQMAAADRARKMGYLNTGLGAGL